MYIYIHIFVYIFILEYMYKERYRYRYSTQKKEERFTVELKQFHLCRCSSHSRRPPLDQLSPKLTGETNIPRFQWFQGFGCDIGMQWMLVVTSVLVDVDGVNRIYDCFINHISYRQLQIVSENGATPQSVQCPFMDPYRTTAISRPCLPASCLIQESRCTI